MENLNDQLGKAGGWPGLAWRSSLSKLIVLRSRDEVQWNTTVEHRWKLHAV